MANRLGLRLGALGAIALLLLGWSGGPLGPAAASAAPGVPSGPFVYGQRVEYPLVFPVGGSGLTLTEEHGLGFGACRGGCTRRHEGVDIMAPKMTPVYAAAAATVAWTGSTCCSVFLAHDDGWQTWYIHLNNDTPGTDDGKGWGIAPGIVSGTRVSAGQLIGWVGDSGNAEDTAPHLHFELLAPGGVKVDPFPSLAAAFTGEACPPGGSAPLAAVLGGGPLLRRGSTGEGVRQLQAFLRVRGYPVGTVDGIFGPGTEAAVRAFQRRQGLPVDGAVGGRTRAAIARMAELPAIASLVRSDGRLLSAGQRGPDVRELKRWLAAAGHAPGPTPFGPGFGPATRRAVRAFQKDHGLVVDGVVGPATRTALARVIGLAAASSCG